MCLTIFRLLILATAAFVLSACGGGGSDSGNQNNTPTAQISSTNQVATAVSAADAERTVSTLFTGTNSGLFGTPFNAASTATKGLFKPTLDGSKMTLLDSGFCSSGSIDTPADPTATSGTITFTDCVLTGTNFIVNGEIGFTVTVTGSDNSFTLILSFNGFTIADNIQQLAAINGRLTLIYLVSPNVISTSVSASNLSLTLAGETVVLANYAHTLSTDLTSGETSVTFHYAVTSGLLGGTLIVTTDTNEGGAPVLSNLSSPYPYSGVIVLIGAENDRARITINGGTATDTVTIEYDLNADGIYDDGIDVLTWPQFLAQGQYLLDMNI